MSGSSTNSCHFVGRVGKDVELTYSQKSTPIANFSIAISEVTRQDDGSYAPSDPTWVDITAFDKLAERLEKVGKKGNVLSVAAAYTVRKYKDNNGELKTHRGFRLTDFSVLHFANKSSDSDDEYENTDDLAAPF